MSASRCTGKLPNPRTAAEWAEFCTDHHTENTLELCIQCADAYARQQVEATKHQAREEVASLLNGKSPLVADPIFDALTVATGLMQREMKQVEAFRERAAEKAYWSLRQWPELAQAVAAAIRALRGTG